MSTLRSQKRRWTDVSTSDQSSEDQNTALLLRAGRVHLPPVLTPVLRSQHSGVMKRCLMSCWMLLMADGNSRDLAAEHSLHSTRGHLISASCHRAMHGAQQGLSEAPRHLSPGLRPDSNPNAGQHHKVTDHLGSQLSCWVSVHLWPSPLTSLFPPPLTMV